MHVVLSISIVPTERPLQTTWETGTSSTSKPRVFDRLDDPTVSLEQDLLRLVPISSGLGSLDTVVVSAVKVGEDSVLVFETAISPDWRV
jgi:hypothetical protein